MNNKFFLGSDISSFKNLGKTKPVSKVVVVVDEDTSYIAGDDTGYTFTVTNPYGTQQMANNLLQVAKGYTYQGFKADQITLPVTAELGDALTMRGVYGMLSNRSISFSPLFTADVETPWEQEVQHNYPYEGSYKKEIKQKVALGKDYYGTRITRQHGLEVVRTDSQGNESAFVRLNSDVLAFYDATGQEALYFDAVAGKYRFRGDVEITGGTINVNNRFKVDVYGNIESSGSLYADGDINLGGNITLGGNIDMSTGVITWGSNVPKGEKGDKGDTGPQGPAGPQGDDGDPAAYLRSIGITEISSGSVKSPRILGGEIKGADIMGGKFWDINQEAYIEMDASYGAGHRYADLRFFQGSSEIFRIAADNTLSDFDLSSGGRVTVALNTIAGMLLYAESTYNGEFWTDTIWPQGTWNFEDANVEGLTQTYVPVWG
jgi:hypothetical protein